MSDQIEPSSTPTSAPDSSPYVPNPEAARLIAALIQTGFFPSSIPECMSGYWPLALAEIQAVADQGERQRFQAFSTFTIDLPKEQSWGMMYEVRTFLLPKVNRTEKDRQLFWAKDAMSPPPELEWVVPGLFARPSLNILVGDPGSKKTYLAMDLAVCVANGIPWLGFSAKDHQSEPLAGSEWKRQSGQMKSHSLDAAGSGGDAPPPAGVWGSEIPKTEDDEQPDSAMESHQPKNSPIPALFIDEESGYLQMWFRFNSVLHAHNSDPATSLAYTSLAGYNLRDPEDTDALIKRALSIKAGLIVIDALSDLLSSTDSTGSIQPVLFNLRRLADTSHAAVLLIHHTNREGGYRGSSSIAASADLMLEISSPPDRSLIELRTLKARFHAPDPFCARAHFETTLNGEPRVYLTAKDEKPEDSVLHSTPQAFSGAELAILKFLSTRPNSTRAQMTTALSKYSEGTIRNTLLVLRGSGLVLITKETIQDKSPEYILSHKAIEEMTEMESVNVQLDKN